MFEGAKIFNKDISSWDTADVTDMSSMFKDATAFNQAILTCSDKWKTDAVTLMTNMFNKAAAFNQDISTWTVTSVTNNADMWTGADAMTTTTKKPCVTGGSSTTDLIWQKCLDSNGD